MSDGSGVGESQRADAQLHGAGAIEGEYQSMPDDHDGVSESARSDAYWKDNVTLLARLLIIWFVVSYGFGILLVDVLNGIPFFGFKLGFWFAQQGSIYVFVALIFVYAAQMKKLAEKHGY